MSQTPSRRWTQDVMRSSRPSQASSSAPHTSEDFEIARGRYYDTLRNALTIYLTHKENASLFPADKKRISSLPDPALTRYQIDQLTDIYPSIEPRTLSKRIHDAERYRFLKSLSLKRPVSLAEGARSIRQGEKVRSSAKVMSDAMRLLGRHVLGIQSQGASSSTAFVPVYGPEDKAYVWRNQSHGLSVRPRMPPKEDFDIFTDSTEAASPSTKSKGGGTGNESREDMRTRESTQTWRLMRRLEHLQLAWSGVGKKSKFVESCLQTAKVSVNHYKDMCGVGGGTVMNVDPTCERAKGVPDQWPLAKERLWTLADPLTREFEYWSRINSGRTIRSDKDNTCFNVESVRARHKLERKAYWSVKEPSVDQ